MWLYLIIVSKLKQYVITKVSKTIWDISTEKKRPANFSRSLFDAWHRWLVFYNKKQNVFSSLIFLRFKR